MESRERQFEFAIPREAAQIQALALDIADMIERYPDLFPHPPVSAARLRAWTHALSGAIVEGVILEQEVRRHQAVVEAVLVRLKRGLWASIRCLEGQALRASGTTVVL